MDVTPMEKAMMEQFSGQVETLQVKTQDDSSTNVQPTCSGTVLDNELNSTATAEGVPNSSASVEHSKKEVPAIVQTEEGKGIDAAEISQDLKCGDDLIEHEERGGRSEDFDDTHTEEDEAITSRPVYTSLLHVRIESEDALSGERAENLEDLDSSELHSEEESEKTSLGEEKLAEQDLERADKHWSEVHKSARKPRFVGPFTCDICDKQFEKRKTFTNHKRRCGGKTMFRCQSCPKFFERSDSLKHHTIRHHSEIPPQHQCEICGKCFYKKDKLRRHQITHTPADKLPVVKKFQCETCNNYFSSRTELTIHIRTHTGEKPCLCEHCGKQFTSQRDAKKHLLRMHTNWRETAKLHFCSICHKGFLEKSNMLKHINAVHRDNRPFPCDQCEYRGKNKRDLQRHQVRHMADKPFSCLVCDKKYNSNEALSYHKRAHHGMDKVYRCTECNIDFHVREAYNHHMKSHKKDLEDFTAEKAKENAVTEEEGKADEKSVSEESQEKELQERIQKEEDAEASQEVATIIFVPLTS